MLKEQLRRMKQVTGKAKELRGEIRRAERIMAVTHENMDGDAVGSLLCVKFAIEEETGKKVRVFAPDPVPKVFHFIPDIGEIELLTEEEAKKGADLTFFVDMSDPSRAKGVGEILAQNSKVIVNIDHHATNGSYGRFNFVAEFAPSSTVVIYEVLKTAGVEIPPKALEYAFLGLYTDTGGFKYTNTGPLAFHYASIFAEAGFANLSPELIARKVYEEKDAKALRARGVAFANAKIEADGKLVWFAFTRQVMREHNLTDEDTVGVVEELRNLNTALVSVVFRELEDCIKISFRSREGFSVREVAEKFGGGGHDQAAGCTIKGTNLGDVVSRVIGEVKRKLNG